MLPTSNLTSGAGLDRTAYIALPDEARSSVREEVRRGLGDTGGPIEIDCEIRLASGARWYLVTVILTDWACYGRGPDALGSRTVLARIASLAALQVKKEF